MADQSAPSPSAPEHTNEVLLRGRVSTAAESRDLPSGDLLVTLRVVVDRPARAGNAARRVDVIDVACWSKRSQRTALTLRAGDLVEVTGALRRRFFAAGAGRTSRYEVEAGRVVRTARASRARAASASSAG